MACGLFVLGGSNFRGNVSLYELNPRRFLPEPSVPLNFVTTGPLHTFRLVSSRCNSASLSDFCMHSSSSGAGGFDAGRTCRYESLHKYCSVPWRCAVDTGLPLSDLLGKAKGDATRDGTQNCPSFVSPDHIVRDVSNQPAPVGSPLHAKRLTRKVVQSVFCRHRLCTEQDKDRSLGSRGDQGRELPYHAGFRSSGQKEQYHVAKPHAVQPPSCPRRSLKDCPPVGRCLKKTFATGYENRKQADGKGVCFVCPTDQRRLTYSAGGLQNSMPELRRETVILTSHVAPKNIPIIDDDDETNIDDDEDFFPAYLKGKELKFLAESDKSSSAHDDQRGKRKSEPAARRSSTGIASRKWGARLSLNADKLPSFDLDDADDLDGWSDTTEVIYPPSDSETVDTYASTYQVFAVDEQKVPSNKTALPTSLLNMDEGDSETTEPVSLDDQEDEDPPDEMQVSSSASTPDPDCDLARTPDKEQFVKENFESFTPVPVEKFAQQVASLEQLSEISDPSNMPFSPRLSLSSRFLSRSHFGAGRLALSGTSQRPDSWFDPLRKTKSEMARAMDETRRHLVDMNWRPGSLLNESPDNEDPPSPPTKLDSKEQSLTTSRSVQLSQATSNPGISSKKEGDNPAAVPSSSLHQVSTCSSRSCVSLVKRTFSTSPTQGTNPPTFKEGRRNSGSSKTDVTSSSSNGAMAATRQAPSYFRPTKASRLKSAASSSQGSQADGHTNIKSGGSLGSGKGEVASNKRPGKARLSAAKLAMCASTPNLAVCFEEDEDKAVKTASSHALLSSNLRALADLSLSVPDINAVDDSPSTDSSSSDNPCGEKDKAVSKANPLKGSHSDMNSRLSVPPSSFISKMPFSLAKGSENISSNKVSDARLMLPPLAPVRTARPNLLRRAAQVRKRSSSELTLEQAKSILLGNSGILGARQNSVEEEVPSTSPVPTNQSNSSESLELATSSSSSSTLKSQSLTSHVTSPSCPVFDLEDADFKGSGFSDSRYPFARTLAMVQEIELTASQQRRERAAGAALRAERFDPPERDQPSMQRVVSNAVPVSVSASVHIDAEEETSMSDSVTPCKVELNDFRMPDVSVRKRVAHLNHRTSGHVADESSSFKIPFRRNVHAIAGSPACAESQISPRSQSDTGLGSETDTDSDLQYQLTPDAESSVQNIVLQGRSDRRHLSLQLQRSAASSPTAAPAVNHESLQTCANILADLKSAVQRAKDFHMQLQQSTSSGAGHQQMLGMMSAAFHETHLALAHLALQSPSTEEGWVPHSCPLVGETGGSRESTVIEKARDMLQPFVSQLSHELSNELIKLVKEQVERNPS